MSAYVPASAGASADMAIEIDDSSTESSSREYQRTVTSNGNKRKCQDNSIDDQRHSKRTLQTSTSTGVNDDDHSVADPLSTLVATGPVAEFQPEPPATSKIQLQIENSDVRNRDKVELNVMEVPQEAQVAQMIQTSDHPDNDMGFLSERVRISMSPFPVNPASRHATAASDSTDSKTHNGDAMRKAPPGPRDKTNTPEKANAINNSDAISPPPPTSPSALQSATCAANNGETPSTESIPCGINDGLAMPPALDRILRCLQLFIPVCMLLAVVAAFPLRSSFPNGRQPHNHPFPGWNDALASKKRLHSLWGMTTVIPGASTERIKPLTLRDILNDRSTGFHLAMAPAFFGFYGYFGALAAWVNAVDDTDGTSSDYSSSALPLKSVAGASAGAMAAVLLAAGISPMQAAEFCANMTVDKFADFPGFGAVFRGNKFERLMHDFLLVSAATGKSPIVTLEEALFPVAVTAFDLQTMSGKVLTTGSMARAARASATFPGLFQPVGWNDAKDDYVFVDGGIADMFGMVGLSKTIAALQQQKAVKSKRERVINLRVGSFGQTPPPGPSTLPGSPDVVSISIQGLPQPGPWAMKNGPLAFEASRLAMTAALDVPLQQLVKKRKEKEDPKEEEGRQYLLVVEAK